MSNRIELLLQAVISPDSERKITEQVTALQDKLNNLKIDKDLVESFKEIEKFSIDSSSAKKLQDELKKAQEELNKFKAQADSASEALSNVNMKVDTKSAARDIEKLQKEVEAKGGALQFEIDMSSGRAEVTKASAVFDEFGQKVTTVFQKVQAGNDTVWDTSKIKNYESTVRDTNKAHDTLLKQIQELGRQGKITSEQMSGLTKDLTNVKDSKADIDALALSLKNMGDTNTYVDILTQKLEKLESQGKITKTQFEELNRYIGSSGNINTKQYENLTHKIDLAAVSTSKYKQQLKQEQVESNKLKDAQLALANAHSAVTAARNKMPRIAKHEDYNKLIGDLNQVNTLYKRGAMSAGDMTVAINGVQSRLKAMTAEAVQMQRTQIGIVDSFKIAMEKFPVWMAATTLFYGAIRTSKEFMGIIVDIDTKMTDLRKVMEDGTDFGAVFDRATESAEKFGRTISETMDSYIEFAKQGFKGDELGALADAATVAANVADLTSKAASEYITATLIQWNKEAEESMDIIDKWNAISNNYATTTEYLAQGQARAASAASVMMMSMEELNGVIATTTAATKQSGNEIGNFFKSALPRLTSKPAEAALKSLDVALLDHQGNLRNVIDIYTDVAHAIKGVDEVSKMQVIEGLAGKFHLSRMAALLDDLGKVDSMYYQVMETQQNATNSAIEENAEYLKSFEARLAGARREVEQLALGLGDAFLNESMIMGIKLFSDGVGAITKWVDQYGALSVAMGAAGAVALLTSKNLRTVVEALVLGTSKMTEAKLEATGLEQGMTRTGVAARTLSTSLKSVGLALGFTAVLTLLGIGFEKLIGKMAKTRERAEELKNAFEDSKRSYASNAEEIDRLTKTYADLEAGLASHGANEQARAEYTKELVKTQEQLAELMPSVKISEDEYGNAVYITSQQLQVRNELMQKQIELQEASAKAEEKIGMAEKFKADQKEIKNLEGDIKSALNTFKGLSNFMENVFKDKDLITFDIKSLEDAQKAYEILIDRQRQALEEGDMKLFGNIQDFMPELETALATMEFSQVDIQRLQAELINSTADGFNKLLETTDRIDEGAKDVIGSLEYMLVSAGATSDEATRVFSSFTSALNADAELQSFSTAYDNALKNMLRAKEAYDLTPTLANKEKLHSEIQVLEQTFNLLKQKMLEILSLTVDPNSDMFAAMSDSLDKVFTKMAVAGSSAEDFADSTGKSLELIRASSEEAAEGMGELEEGITHVDNALQSLTGTSHEAIDGVYELEGQMDGLLNILNFLEAGTADYEAVQRDLLAVEEKLLNQYPHLRKQKELYGLTTEQILQLSKQETMEADIVQSAYVDLSNGMLKANEARVLSSYNASKAILNNLKAEREAYKMNLDNAGKQLMRMSQIKNPSERQSAMIKDLESDVKSMAKGLGFYGDAIEQSEAKLKSSIEQMKTFPTYSSRNTSRTEKNTSTTKKNTSANDKNTKAKKANTKAKNSNTKAKKSNTKATEKAAKEEEKAAFIADKYARAINNLTLALKEQQAVKSMFPQYSKEYQTALTKEIQLEQEKLKLMKAQEVEMKKSIAAGKLAPKGVVTETQQKQTAKVVSTNRKLSGWQASVNSGFGSRWHPIDKKYKVHEGVDLAQKKGTRLDANVEGIVKRAMKHNSYGNVVYVVDNSGKEHRYAHLDSIAVKAGQKVKVGDKLGAIGSTGKSTGAHLHYEVRVNGKAVNPMDFVNAAKGNKAIQTTVKEVTNVSKEVAQTQADVYASQDDLIKHQQEILEQEMRLNNLAIERVRAELSIYERQRQLFGHKIDWEVAKYDDLNKASQRYINVLNRQEVFMRKKLDTNRAELAHLDKLIASGKYQGVVLDELTDRHHELMLSITALNQELSKMASMQIDGKLYKWSKELEMLDFEIAKLDQTMRNNAEGSTAWMSAMTSKTQLIATQRKNTAQEIAELSALLRTATNLTPDTIEEYERRLRELTLRYRELGITMQEVTKAQKDAEKSAWDEIANNLINTYKKAMEQKREAHMKSLDEEMKREDERHKRVMKNLQDELDKFKKVIDERIKALDDEADEDSYRKEMSDLDKDRQKILDKISGLSMDDSREAKYERAKLQEELSKIDETIEEKRNRRERDKRKENLQEMLKDKEEDIKKREEIENDYHDGEKERIDRLKEYWDKYYTDRINDERMFAQWRKDLANGEYEHILELFDDLAIELEGTLGDITDTMNGTMEGVGTAIRQNVIDELREAIRLAQEFNDTMVNGGNVGGGGGGDLSSGLGSSQPPAKAKYEHKDYQVITGKLIRHNLAPYARNNQQKLALQKHGTEMANQGRARGSKLDKTVQYSDLIRDMNPADIKGFTEYMERYIRQLPATEYELKDWLAREIQRLKVSASFDTGGFTGNWGSKKGKLATLHQNELILNEKETNKFGDLIDKFDNMNTALSLSQGVAKQVTSTNGDSMQFIFKVDEMYATKQEVESFSKAIMSKIQREKGSRK